MSSQGSGSLRQRGFARWRAILDAIASVAMIAAAFLVIWAILSGPRTMSPGVRTAEPEVPAAPVSLQGAPTRGSRDARVAIIEYSDFACPHCASFARDTLPLLMQMYIDPGTVMLAFRHLPSERLHPLALTAAEAAECAAQQGRFWEMHDRMFTADFEVNTQSLGRLADAIGLNTPRFAECLQGAHTSSRIREDVLGASHVGVGGTPTFLLGFVQPDGRVQVVKRMGGALPYARFAEALEEILRIKRTS